MIAWIAGGMLAAAQDYFPTVNWPYLLPEFYEGEAVQIGGGTFKAHFNVHLGQGTLHFVKDGTIGEAPSSSINYVTVGDDVYNNVGGKLMKVIARSDNGFVVEQTLADYSAVVRDTGSYAATTNAATGHSYDENYGNYSYLVTNVYEDLLSIKNDAEELPVNVQRFLIIKGNQIQASKKHVSSFEGVDKKAFADFLKVEKINWKDPADLLKVIDYVIGK